MSSNNLQSGFQPTPQIVLRPVANRESLPTMYDLPSEEIGDICYERQRAEQAIQHAEQEHQRAERLAEMLRQLGHDPDQL